MWRVWLLDTKYPLELVFRQKLSLLRGGIMPDGKQTPELNRKCCKLNLRYFGETKLVFVKLHKLLKTIKLRVEFISVLDTRSVVCWNLYSRYFYISWCGKRKVWPGRCDARRRRRRIRILTTYFIIFIWTYQATLVILNKLYFRSHLISFISLISCNFKLHSIQIEGAK